MELVKKNGNAVSELNKNAASENTETVTAEIRTAGKNTTGGHKSVRAAETGTALTDAIIADPAETQKKIPPRRDGGGVARRHD